METLKITNEKTNESVEINDKNFWQFDKDGCVWILVHLKPNEHYVEEIKTFNSYREIVEYSTKKQYKVEDTWWYQDELPQKLKS